jgi:SAM-dependent methyltransferase
MSETADYNSVFATYCKAILKHFNLRDKLLLDLGCGSGNLSKRFAEEGFDVIGVDSSEDMLSLAADRCAGLDIRFIRQDIRRLDLFGTVNVTVAAFDVLNHLNTLADIKKCFDKIYLFTEPGGVFVFDYNTVYKHREVLGSNTFTFDYDDFFCSWENECFDANTVTMNITVFERKGDIYHRFNETITETAFPQGDIEHLLKECGFRVEVTDFETGENPTEKTERLLFSAHK